MMVAPAPAADSFELPFEFVATTRAKTASPNCKENGAAVKVDSGIVHDLAAIIVASLPSQFVVSSM